MRILWFSLTPSNFTSTKRGYNGGGWISSLETALAFHDGIELGIAFLHTSSVGKSRNGRITYYPLRRPQNLIAKTNRFLRVGSLDRTELDLAKRVVDDFKPDVIQVFGTESSFGLISRETGIPVVIHLQGLMGPYMNAWVPPGYRMWDYVGRRSLNPIQIVLGVRALAFNRHAAEREQAILRSCKAFMGRTEWDRAFVSLHAPQAEYFTCWEVLRSCFYEPGEWDPPKNPVLVSTISNPLYKGQDMILKTARMLKSSGCSNFEWRVFGVRDFRVAERTTGIRAAEVGVCPMGVASAEQLRDNLLHASVYMHPSYIENSPNSVCEAQMLGVPVVATNVGGVSSLFDANRSRCLIPANDPLMATNRICETFLNPELFQSDSEMVRNRHNPNTIVQNILSVYKKVIST